MKYHTILLEQEGDIARVTLSRPEVHNAFDGLMVRELGQLFDTLGRDRSVRAVVLTGSGSSFCAGADLNWMKRMVNYSREENLRDSMEMAEMFRSVNMCPQPVLGWINGSAFGGGVGLVAACDLAIMDPNAILSFSEVKLGIAPAIISPYILARVSPARARWLFISGERIDAARALKIGLVDAVAREDEAMAMIERSIKILRSSGPIAVKRNKELVEMNRRHSGEELMRSTAQLIAELRVSDEGQKGIGAFLGKKRAPWNGKE